MKEFSLLSSISTEYDDRDRCYVLHLSYSQPASVLAAALSTRALKLYTLGESKLQYTGQLEGHTGRITGTSFLPEKDGSLLQTSSADGSIREWDVRSRACAKMYRTHGEVSCAASHHHLLAAGVGDNIVFWDRRYERHVAAVFNETHYQDVTQVTFGEHDQQVFLISGSEDGSLAAFDVGGGRLEEEEGFRGALNLDTAVARIGLFGNQMEKLWCCTGTESLFFWDWLSGCTEDVEGGGGPSGEILNPRDLMQVPVDVLNARQPDYLVQCEYDDMSQQLFLVAGTSDGTCGLYHLEQSQRQDQKPSISDLKVATYPAALLARGHTDIVRCMERSSLSVSGPNPRDGGALGIWFTGGEDSKICVWNVMGVDSSGDDHQQPDNHLRPNMHNKQHIGRRASPY